MSDNLTLQFQQELRNRRKGSGVTDITPMPSGSLSDMRGRTLGEIGGVSEWADLDETGNLLTAIGKGAWAAFETAGFGLPRLLLTEEAKEWLEPKSFIERVGAGIGTAAGFLQPMKAAGGLASIAVKTFAKGGVKKFSKKFVDDSIKIMEKDKEFMAWANKKMQRGEIQEGTMREFMESLIDAPKQKLLTLGTKEGEALLARSAKDRMNFAKTFREDTPKILMEKLEQAGFRGKNAEQIVNTLGDDIAQRIGAVTDGTSKTFKFPMTRLHQVIGGWTNNSRLGNIAGHAVEESILFAAVETPMNYFRSVADDTEFKLGETLGHAFLLGSMLGLIRPLIPGGKDQPILRTGWSRITNTIKNRRKWRNYELEANKARGITEEMAMADRLKFELEVKNIFENQPDIFSSARKLVKADPKRGIAKDYEIPIKTAKDIESLMGTASGRATLKRSMVDVEKAFFDDWYPAFLKEIPRDLWGSAPRMLAGSLAFNFETYKDWIDGADIPLEDIVFHTALGMFMSKRGKELEYTDSSTGKLKTLYKERPYVYGKELKKVDKYLQMLGSNLDSSLFRALYNESEALKKGFLNVNADSKDMQKLKKIAEKYGIIVEKYVGETKEGVPTEREIKPGKTGLKVKNEKGEDVPEERLVDFNDEVYTAFSQIVKTHFIPKATDVDYDVLEGYELSAAQLKNLRKDLRETEFDALKEYTIKGKPGINSSTDVLDVVLAAGEGGATTYRDIVQRAVLEMYNELYRMEDENTWTAVEQRKFLDFEWNKETNKLILRPANLPSKLNTPNHILSKALLGNDANVMMLLRPWVEFRGTPVHVTQEMVNKVFGTWEKGKQTTEGLMDKFHNETHELVMGSPEVTASERRILVGDPVIQNWASLVLNRRAIRQHWRMIEDLSPGAKNELNMFSNLKEYQDVKQLITEIFDEGGYLAHSIELFAGKTKINYDKKTNAGDFSFVSSLLKILQADASRQQTGWIGDGPPPPKESQLSAVKRLKTLLNDKIPLLTMPVRTAEEGAIKRELINQLRDYSAERTLLNIRKSDGTVLDTTDRAKIRVLQQAGILSPKFDMMDVSIFEQGFQSLFERFSKINPDKAGQLDDLSGFIRYLSSQDSNVMHNLVSEVNDFRFYTEMSAAAKHLGMSPANFGEVLINGLTKHTKNFIRGSDGNGFITVGKYVAKVDAGYLAQVVQRLSLLDSDVARVSHKELLSDLLSGINKRFTGSKYTDGKIESLLHKVFNTIFAHPSRASVATRILSQAGVYNPAEKFWTWDTWSKEPQKLNEIIRNVESQMNLEFQLFKTTRDLEMIHQRDRLDNETQYPVDKPVTVNMGEYVKRYKIRDLSGSSGKTLSRLLRGNMEAMKSPWHFYKYMKKQGALLTHKKQQYSHDKWVKNRKLDDSHMKFLLDSVSIYNQLKNAKTRRIIHTAHGQRNPRWEEFTFQDNPVFKEIEDILGELTLISTSTYKRKVDGKIRTFDIRRSDTDSAFESDFYKILGTESAIFRRGGFDTMELMEDISSSSMNQPFVVAYISTLGNGIGIPIGSLTSPGQARKTHAMNNLVKEFIKVYNNRKGELPVEAIREYDKFIEKVLVDTKGVEGEPSNLESDGWEYGNIPSFTKMSRDFTVMLTNTVGDRVMGNEFWDAARGDNWGNSEGLAKKQLRYMKILFNRSAKKFNKTLVNNLIEVLEKPEMSFIPMSIRGDQKGSIKKQLYRFVKEGTKWHYLEDEPLVVGGKMPDVSSLFKRLYREIQDEIEAAGNNLGPEGLNDMTVEDAFPGGIKDASMFDSINVVSESYMRTWRFMSGITNNKIEAIKPIGGLASGTDAVWIDKTVWITDKAWEPYFKRHNIDGIKMGSSVKMAGEKHIGVKGEDGRSEKAIYMDDFNSMEEVMGAEHGTDKVITLPIETFGVSSFVKDTKNATLPIQLGNELTTPSLNESYFNWMYRRNLRSFIEDSGHSFGSGDINDISSRLRYEDMDTSTEQLSLLDMWVQEQLDPTFFVFKRAVKNQFKRQLLDNRGVFTPTNPFGSQSNMIPTWADYGTAGHLRLNKFLRSIDTNKRSIWTYGQIEIDQLNKSKQVDVESIRFIEHNNRVKDEIVNKNSKDDDGNSLLSKEIQTLLDGNKFVKLGKLHKELESYNEELDGKRYEIAIVVHRTPTTRPSDKVIVGLKGFGDLTGNSVRINHADAWLRLEADHDLDKLNYWWDTPSDILRHWDSLSGQIDSISGTQIRRTIQGMNLADGESLVKYNKSERDSQFHRGVVVKSRRMVQFLRNYRNARFGDVPGFSMKMEEGAGRIRINEEEQLQIVERQIAEDIQRTVDAQGRGMDDNIFNSGWFDKILFGDGTDAYPGLVIKQGWEQATKSYTSLGETKYVTSDLERDIVKLVLRPYQRLLQLQTSIYENGEPQRVDYDSLVDYVQIYTKQMNNLDTNIYWNLRKGRTPSGKKYSERRVNKIFKDRSNRFVDPFNLDNAKFGESKEGIDILNQNTGMTAGDRMLGVVGSHDRLRMPHIDYESQVATDKVIMDLFMGSLENVSAATAVIHETFKTDARKIAAVSSIDYRLRRYRDNAHEHFRNGQQGLSEYWRGRAETLENFRNDLQKRIMSSNKTQKFIRIRIRNQISSQLIAGKTWHDYRGKEYNLSYIKSLPERSRQVGQMSKIIERSIWDVRNNKLAVRVRGINSDDYLQTLATYNVLSEITGAGLNPEVVGFDKANEWESDRFNFRKGYGKQWSDYYNNRLEAAMDANDIMSEALANLESHYHKWEGESPGLGQYFVLSMMTPEMNPYIVTYHKGHLMPGFNQTSSQAKFVNLGLRFFSRVDSEMARQVIRMIGRPITNQIAFFRNGGVNDLILGENAITEANIRKSNPVDFESSEGGSPLIDYNNLDKTEALLRIDSINEALDSRLLDNKELNFQNMNEHVLRTIGLTGDVALDYIAFRAPALGLDMIGDIRLLADMSFIPSNAITRSGNVVPISNFNAYLKHKRNQAFVFFGDVSKNKNLFTGKKDMVVPDIYGTPENNHATRDFMKKQIKRFLNERGC